MTHVWLKLAIIKQITQIIPIIIPTPQYVNSTKIQAQVNVSQAAQTPQNTQQSKMAFSTVTAHHPQQKTI